MLDGNGKTCILPQSASYCCGYYTAQRFSNNLLNIAWVVFKCLTTSRTDDPEISNYWDLIIISISNYYFKFQIENFGDDFQKISTGLRLKQPNPDRTSTKIGNFGNDFQKKSGWVRPQFQPDPDRTPGPAAGLRLIPSHSMRKMNSMGPYTLYWIKSTKK